MSDHTEKKGRRLKVVFDMETGDPDDFLTLLLLLGHPRVDLIAVTIIPGSRWQVGVVRWALRQFGRDIPVGAYNLGHANTSVSIWHYLTWGSIPPSDEAEPAPELLLRVCDLETTVVTGGPLRNLPDAILLGEKTGSHLRIGRLVAQGGFAGEGVVPREKQLAKFTGRTTCPSYNLMKGGPVRVVLDSTAIRFKRFVSKNVCHRIVCDANMTAAINAARGKSRSMEMLATGLGKYVATKRQKKLHDLFAACCAIDESCAVWAEVTLFRQQDEWGSMPCPGSGIWITIDWDRLRFMETLLAS